MGDTGGADARTGKYRKTKKTQLPRDRQLNFLRTLKRDQVAVNASRLSALVNDLRLFQKVAAAGSLAKVERGVKAAIEEKALDARQSLAPLYSTAKASELQRVAMTEAMTHINVVWVASVTFWLTPSACY